MEIILSMISFMYLPLRKHDLISIQDGSFWGCSQIEEKAPSVSTVTYLHKFYDLYPKMTKLDTVTWISYLLVRQKDADSNISFDSSYIAHFQLFCSVSNNIGIVFFQVLYLNLRLIYRVVLKHMIISAKLMEKHLWATVV